MDRRPTELVNLDEAEVRGYYWVSTSVWPGGPARRALPPNPFEHHLHRASTLLGRVRLRHDPDVLKQVGVVCLVSARVLGSIS
jgi:hypothetical protein